MESFEGRSVDGVSRRGLPSDATATARKGRTPASGIRPKPKSGGGGPSLGSELKVGVRWIVRKVRCVERFFHGLRQLRRRHWKTGRLLLFVGRKPYSSHLASSRLHLLFLSSTWCGIRFHVLHRKRFIAQCNMRCPTRAEGFFLTKTRRPNPRTIRMLRRLGSAVFLSFPAASVYAGYVLCLANDLIESPFEIQHLRLLVRCTSLYEATLRRNESVQSNPRRRATGGYIPTLQAEYNLDGKRRLDFGVFTTSSDSFINVPDFRPIGGLHGLQPAPVPLTEETPGRPLSAGLRVPEEVPYLQCDTKSPPPRPTPFLYAANNTYGGRNSGQPY